LTNSATCSGYIERIYMTIFAECPKYTDDRERLSQSKTRVLYTLLEAAGGWVPNHQLCLPSIGGIEGTRRLRELRASGYPIEKKYVSEGTWAYRLLTERANDKICSNL
jgi:hypothetical protein